MEIDGDSELLKISPHWILLDILGYLRDINGHYGITWDIIGYIKGLKCSPHGRAMDIIRINLILSYFSHFRLTLQFLSCRIRKRCGRSRKCSVHGWR